MPTWTTPVDRSTGYIVLATDWNATGQDDLAYLYGDVGWTNVSPFTNSYTAVGGQTPRFRLIGQLVVLQGAVTGGTVNTSAFTLPAGYHPSVQHTFASVQNAAFGVLVIGTGGTVTPVTSGTNVNLYCAFSVL